MADTVLAQLAALKTAPIGALKQKWRDLFEREPPPYNRRFLESRLAYRIQELAYGGLKPETIERLEALADELEGKRGKRRRRIESRPIAGTRLIREWKGVEHCVTVRDEDFEYQGRPYKSLSAIARAITGTRWNGWCSSASRTSGARDGEGQQASTDPAQAALRGLYPQVHRGGAGAGVQQPRCPARGLRGLRRQPAGRGLAPGRRPL